MRRAIVGSSRSPYKGVFGDVAIRAAYDASVRILIIVQEAHLPEPDPITYGETAWMYYVSPGDNPYPLGNFADNRSRVWVRGEGDAAVDGLIWPVKN